LRTGDRARDSRLAAAKEYTTLTDPTRPDAIAIVPLPAAAGADGAEFEVRPEAEVDSETAVGYVAASLASEIMDIAMAIVAIAWKPLRRDGSDST
jgi:hypothetical protein